MKLSPLAEAVIKDHRAAPNDVFFDLAIFGSMFRAEVVEQLQRAYFELEDAGLVERSGEFARFFDQILPLYRLASADLRDTKVA